MGTYEKIKTDDKKTTSAKFQCTKPGMTRKLSDNIPSDIIARDNYQRDKNKI